MLHFGARDQQREDSLALVNLGYKEETGREGDRGREKPKGDQQGRQSEEIRLVDRQRKGGAERKLRLDRGRKEREEREDGRPAQCRAREGRVHTRDPPPQRSLCISF